MKVLKWIYHRLQAIWYMFRYLVFIHTHQFPYIASIEETMDELIEHRKSVARFGDGEIRWIFGFPQDSFQTQNESLKKDLIRVLTEPNKNCLITLPPEMCDLKESTPYAKRFWSEHFVKEGKAVLQYLRVDRKYYNTDISRFYIGYKDAEQAKKRFQRLRHLWADRNVLIVEGEKTRLGVGNDLFDNTKSIRRILAPSRDAYGKYTDILHIVEMEYQRGDLVLLALGPTATVLAYDLSLKGLQAIDIGHVDVEYEWFRLGTREKVALKGKYVNEAGSSGKVVEDIFDETYLLQIVRKIGLE